MTAPIAEVEVTAKMRVIAYNEAESIASRWAPAYMTARQGLIDDIADSLINARRLERDAFAEREAAVRRDEREAWEEVRMIASTVTLKRSGCHDALHESLCNTGDFDTVGAREASEMFARIAAIAVIRARRP